MKTLMRLAAFRCLNADDAAIGGAPSDDAGASAPDETTEEFSLDKLAEDAYQASEGVSGEAGEDDETDLGDEKETEKKDEEKSAADGDDDESKETETDPLALPEEFVKAHPEQAQALADRIETLRQNEEALAPVLAMEQAFADKDQAPTTLKGFAEALAKHHGFDLAAALGLQAAPTQEAKAAETDWKALGFDSQEEFDAAPEWQQKGYDSRKEMELDAKLKALEEKVNPILDQQKQSAENAQKQTAQARFESAVKDAAPAAIKAIELAHGWKPTEAQVLAGASKFPELAAQDLPAAVLAAHPVELAKHYGSKSVATAPKKPEMPQGGDQRGVKVPDPDTASVEELTEFAYSQI